jgi:hypothetical protein
MAFELSGHMVAGWPEDLSVGSHRLEVCAHVHADVALV